MTRRRNNEVWQKQEDNEVIFNASTGNDESAHYHADQYVDRVRSLDRFEYHDSFDPSR